MERAVVDRTVADRVSHDGRIRGDGDPGSVVPPSPGVEVVPVLDAPNRRRMRHLLEEGFPDAGFDWNLAFEASPGRFGHGVLLVVDGVARGAMLVFEKEEILGGVRRRVINFSSWYLQHAYRRHVIAMVRRLAEDAETIYTVCTAISSVRSIGKRLGFRTLGEGTMASLPFVNGFRSPSDVAVEPWRPAEFDPGFREVIEDHRRAGAIVVLICSDEGSAPLVWKSGPRLWGLPAARLLHAGDYDLVARALPAIHAHLVRHFGIFGLYLPRVAALAGLRSVPRRGGPTLLVKGDVADEDVSLLYSELHWLPLTSRSVRRRLELLARRVFTGKGR